MPTFVKCFENVKLSNALKISRETIFASTVGLVSKAVFHILLIVTGKHMSPGGKPDWEDRKWLNKEL